MTAMFRRDQLVETAFGGTGLDDLGEPSWQEGLDRLLDGLDGTARLNDVGTVMVETELVNYLSNRLRILDWRKAHPEVARGSVSPAHRHLRPAPDRHHHPLRPLGPRPRPSRPADLGGRPPLSPTADGHLRH